MSHSELLRCIEVIEKLRDPIKGCPWDLEQTHESLLKYLIEETYEFIEATELKDPKLMEEELGDVLLQILLHSTIAQETTKEKGEKKYSIDTKFLHAPALEAAFKIGTKSTTVNFDWQDYYQVISKVEEEWQEVKEELPPGGKFNSDRVKEEIGDLLFSVAQLARHLNLNPEECLKDANKKFIKRFQKVEDIVKSMGG